ncbi:MAG: 5-(carboxyamino)imidazole ribonucleotide synthase, partial [Nitratireductor sp.]|nr:5-(carboxyamino)imidazole ribonucleotide synthase [Nitratireductor sp.]
MLAIAAARLGFQTVIFDPDKAAPAAQTANQHMAAAYDDQAALARFAAAADVITYEFENIPVETARYLAGLKPVFPPASALEASQDRLVEKRFINGLGVATAPFFEVESQGHLVAALETAGGKGILKTRRLGYDGRGQVLIESPAGARGAWEEIGGHGVILEGFVDFELEISVVTARAPGGAFRAFEPAMNRHLGGILRTSTVPAPVPGEVLAEAIGIAAQIASALDYVGVIGVEFFVTRDHRLLVNEIAPRVHNSGHWTEAACAISQFEQHVRAIAGLPLGETTRHSDCVMENLIGDDILKVPAILAEGNAVLHLYGKAEARPGRKMGHVTRL